FLMNTYAQANDSDVQELLKNPNIVWAAEIDVPISFEGGPNNPNFSKFIMLEDYGTGNSTASVFKSTAKVHAFTNFDSPNTYIISNLVEEMENGSLIPRDENNKRISKEELRDYYGAIDTFVSFDPNTYVETMEILETIENVEWYIAKILMYQDKRDGKLHTLLQSLSPLFQLEFDKKKKYLATDYISFTIDMVQTSDKNLSLDNKNIPWVKSIRNTGIDLNKAKILKGNTSDMAKKIFYDAPSQGKLPINVSESISLIDVLEPSYVDEISTSVDTIVTFEPNIQDEKIEILKREKNSSAIERVHARMNWYWNEDKKKLECKLINVSPQYRVNDSSEKFLYDVTLFTVWFNEQ
ncbi:MAG: hypothetical protein ACPG5P_07005, partial [Saprospiraceae bacterium]